MTTTSRAVCLNRISMKYIMLIRLSHTATTRGLWVLSINSLHRRICRSPPTRPAHPTFAVADEVLFRWIRLKSDPVLFAGAVIPSDGRAIGPAKCRTLASARYVSPRHQHLAPVCLNRISMKYIMHEPARSSLEGFKRRIAPAMLDHDGSRFAIT